MLPERGRTDLRKRRKRSFIQPHASPFVVLIGRVDVERFERVAIQFHVLRVLGEQTEAFDIKQTGSCDVIRPVEAAARVY